MSAAVIEKAIIKSRLAFANNVTKSVAFRKTQLNALNRCLTDNHDIFIDALKQDFRKPAFETVVAEISFVQNDIKHQLYHIDEYVRPQRVEKNLATAMDDPFLQYEPYGLVLVISAWNYPIQLSLCPLIGAIVAGNCAILKPSEVSPATAKVLAELLPKYLDTECYHVITGGPEETKRMLEERFDYIFFTGSTHIGRIVYEAAAKHLTPVTLELGGKSPIYIDESVPNLEMAWKRVLWGKLINCGQTCVAPDYVLCSQTAQKPLIDVTNKILKQFYGDDPKKSNDFARVINERHFDRLSKMLCSSGKPVIGGSTDRSENYISPTLLTDVSPNDPIMQEEIFGPILPIITVNSAQEAIDFIRKKEKPLSMYLFSTKSDVINKFLNETSSGSVCVNDVIMQCTVDSLPFGGVGASGLGAYHGKFSFQTFSHPKSVLIRNYNPIIDKLGSSRYPPYTDGKLTLISQLIMKRRNYVPKYMSHYIMFCLGIIAVFFYQSLFNWYDTIN